jgi:hypothetical protein
MHEFALLPVCRIANIDCTLLIRLNEDLDFRLNSKPNVIKRHMFSGHLCHFYVSSHIVLNSIRGGLQFNQENDTQVFSSSETDR